MLFLKILISISLSCCSAISENDTNNNSSLFLLSKFLELQSDSCGYVQLCTVEKKTNLTFTFKKQPCCRSCSCDETCLDFGNCCPDFWLHHFGNTSLDYAETITKRQNTIHDFFDTEMKDNVTSCVSSRLQSRNIRFGFQGADEGFIMISFCPNSYSGDKTKTNCEGALQLKTTSPNTLIPVTSIETGQTYRNLFCMECHEGPGKRFIDWESWLSCSHKTVEQDLITPSDTLFSYIVLRYFTFCNIVYRPPSLKNITTTTCQQADVSFCSETMTKNTTSVTTMYEQMCREFYLPVYHVKGGTLIIYKNIACYLCNKEEVLSEYCYSLYPDYNEYNLQINIEKLTSDETHEHVLPHLNFRFDSICGVGYVYDEELKNCRKVLCPRLFYLFNGSCEPVLKHLQGVYFKLMLEVRPDVMISSQVYKEYEDTIYSHLTHSTRFTFPDMHSNMWRKTQNQKLVSNVVSIHFKNENQTYADTIQQLQTMLDTVSFIRNNSFKASVSIAVNEVEEISQKLQPRLLDRDTRSQLDAVRVSPVKYSGIAEFELSKSHFCYRLELNASEFIRVGKYSSKVIRTGVRMEGVNFDITENGKHITCISDIISIKSNSTGHSYVEHTTTIHQKNPSELFIIFGSLIALVFLIVAVRLIINCRHGDD